MGRPNKFHKVRQLTYGNESGEAYGITIPRELAKSFLGKKVSIYKSGCGIILDAGA